MRHLDAVCVAVSVPAAELNDWIARGWVQPRGDAPQWDFADIDVARARLVRDLRQDAGIETQTIGVVLSLLDQIHATRRALQAVLIGLQGQPEPVQRAVLERLGGALD